MGSLWGRDDSSTLGERLDRLLTVSAVLLCSPKPWEVVSYDGLRLLLAAG